MPVRIRKVNGYRVTHGGKVSAKRTTKKKAKRQKRLLYAVRHGWKPTGKAAKDNPRKKKKRGYSLAKDSFSGSVLGA